MSSFENEIRLFGKLVLDEDRIRILTKKTTLFETWFLNGARGSVVDEPLALHRNYQVEWVAPKVNLRDLALLRFSQGKTE